MLTKADDVRSPTRAARANLPFTTGNQTSIPLAAGSAAQEYVNAPWKNQRQALHAALHNHPLLAADELKFLACGSDAWIERNTETGKYRVRAVGCKKRWCPRCAQIIRGRLRTQLRQWTTETKLHKGESFRLITLTLRHTQAPLETQLRFLKAAYRRLRQQRSWPRHVRQAAAIVQVNYNNERDDWHPHLHVLALGTFFAHRELKNAWTKASRGSAIVDIRLIKDPKKACDYVASYITRPDEWDLTTTPRSRIQEYILALRGQRLVILTGQIPKLNLDELPATNWERVSTLQTLLREARLGNEQARKILQEINFDVAEWLENCPPPWETDNPESGP